MPGVVGGRAGSKFEPVFVEYASRDAAATQAARERRRACVPTITRDGLDAMDDEDLEDAVRSSWEHDTGEPDIRVHRASTTSDRSVVLEGRLALGRKHKRKRGQRRDDVLIFWDPGATDSFVQLEALRAWGLEYTLSAPIAVNMGDGQPSGACRAIGHVDFQISVSGLRDVGHRFLVMDGGTEDAWSGAPLLLGEDFNECHNPTCDHGSTPKKFTRYKNTERQWVGGAEVVPARDLEELARTPGAVRAHLRLTPLCRRAALTYEDVAPTTPDLHDPDLEVRVNVPHRAPADQAAWLDGLFRKFSDVFVEELPDIRAHPIPDDRLKFRVDLVDPTARPRTRPPRRYSQREREAADEFLDEALKKGLIAVSEHPSGANLVFVPKTGPDGKQTGVRVCVNYTALNRNLRQFNAGVPHIDELLNRVAGAEAYSVVDFVCGFLQQGVEETSKRHTTFQTPHRGNFQWNVTPMGIASAPAYFSAMVARLLDAEINGRWETKPDGSVVQVVVPHVVQYVDDLCLYSSAADHDRLLEALLTKLQAAGLKLRRSKCQLGMREARFLGFVMAGGKKKIDPAKTAAVADLPVPTTKTALRGAIGLVRFFSPFIPHLSERLVRLEELVRDAMPEVRDTWTPRHTEDFEGLKRALVHAPELHAPRFDRPFEVFCDASLHAMGAVIGQRTGEDGEGPFAPVEFYARKFNAAERNYSTTEREELAIYFSARKWRDLLDSDGGGARHTVWTDHQAAVELMRKDESKLSPREWRLWERLQYPLANAEIRYLAGAEQHVADCLSRWSAAALGLEELPKPKENKRALVYLDLFAGSGSALRSIQQCGPLLGEDTAVRYRAIELGKVQRQCIQRVYGRVATETPGLLKDDFKDATVFPYGHDLRDVVKRWASGGAKVPRVDIVTAGCPCPAYSAAGKGRGKKDKRDAKGSLFAETLKAVRLLKEDNPRLVFAVENVVFKDTGASSEALRQEHAEITAAFAAMGGTNSVHSMIDYVPQARVRQLWSNAEYERRDHSVKNDGLTWADILEPGAEPQRCDRDGLPRLYMPTIMATFDTYTCRETPTAGPSHRRRSCGSRERQGPTGAQCTAGCGGASWRGEWA